MNSYEGLRGFITFLILLAILTTGVVGFNYVSPSTNTTSQADEPKIDPLNVSVGNVTDSSADITWTTVDPSTSKLIYSKNLSAECLSNIEASIESCQYSEESEAKNSHSVTLSNLDPEMTYFFRILTNGRIYPTDKNHTFRTTTKTLEPIQTNTPNNTGPSVDEFDGFGEVNISEPDVVNLKPNQVLGVMDENVKEPIDPLGNIDGMMQEEFKEALTYGDTRYDFNKDGEVTMADYPLFIEFVMNYEE